MKTKFLETKFILFINISSILYIHFNDKYLCEEEIYQYDTIIRLITIFLLQMYGEGWGNYIDINIWCSHSIFRTNFKKMHWNKINATPTYWTNFCDF